MADTVIDLRSDTVTKPSPEMRRAMAEADVGDDVFLEDPTINRLQDRAAQIFGRESALFVPSGTMGNLTCIIAHTRHGQEIICEASGHIYNYEMASMSAIGGVLPRVVAGQDGILSWETISKAIRPRIYYRAQTALISLENTHNMAGGTIVPASEAEAICNLGRERRIPVHLDGARLFNAAVALGRDAAELARPFDSVMFCLSKGLGAPVGSVVCGTAEQIREARRIWILYGGAWRQAGIVAAAGLVALEEGPRRLHEDHTRARRLARAIAEIAPGSVDPDLVETNMVFVDTEVLGLDVLDAVGRLAALGVGSVPVPGAVRMVTHVDVDDDGIATAIDAWRSVVASAAKES